MAAMSATDTPAPAARPESVSPRAHHVGALRRPARRGGAARRGRRADGGGRRGRRRREARRCSAAAPSATVGTRIVGPRTHGASSDSAVVGGDGAGREVVGGGDRPQRLAGLHRVRDLAPTPARRSETAWEQDAESASAHVGPPRSCGVCTDSRDSCARHGRAHGYDPSRAAVAHAPAPGESRRSLDGPRTCAHGTVRRIDPTLRLWAQKWRWYERNSLPWNRARIHLELARAPRRSAAGPCTATCSRCCARAGSSSASTCCSSRTSGSPRRRPGRIRIGGGSFLNLGVQVAAVELVEIGAHCMLANGCFVTDGNHRFDDPDRPVPWQGFTTKGPTRIGDNVWCGAQRRRHERRDDRRALRDRRELRRHARPAAVLDRGRRARARPPDDRRGAGYFCSRLHAEHDAGGEDEKRERPEHAEDPRPRCRPVAAVLRRSRAPRMTSENTSTRRSRRAMETPTTWPRVLQWRAASIIPRP